MEIIWWNDNSSTCVQINNEQYGPYSDWYVVDLSNYESVVATTTTTTTLGPVTTTTLPTISDPATTVLGYYDYLLLYQDQI